MVAHRRGLPRAVEDVGRHGRLVQDDIAAGGVGDNVEETAADEIRGVDRGAVCETDAGFGAEGCGEVPAGEVCALLAEKEDVVFWRCRC